MLCVWLCFVCVCVCRRCRRRWPFSLICLAFTPLPLAPCGFVPNSKKAKTMLSTLSRSAARVASMQQRGFKVGVIGAAGGIGQPLSLLMKLDPLVSQLSLYDVVRTPGVAADISHCCTPAQVSAHTGDAQIEAALKGCELVIIPAGWCIN
jgi:hypothetical protein